MSPRGVDDFLSIPPTIQRIIQKEKIVTEKYLCAREGFSRQNFKLDVIVSIPPHWLECIGKGKGDTGHQIYQPEDNLTVKLFNYFWIFPPMKPCIFILSTSYIPNIFLLFCSSSYGWYYYQYIIINYLFFVLVLCLLVVPNSSLVSFEVVLMVRIVNPVFETAWKVRRMIYRIVLRTRNTNCL